MNGPRAAAPGGLGGRSPRDRDVRPAAPEARRRGDPGFSGRGLACVRGERLLFEDLSFSLAPGGALVLRGPNGAGKTSLLRLMAGLLRPAAGEILWNGLPAREDAEAFFRELCYLGHEDAANPALTAAENLSFHVRLKTGAADPGAVAAALARLGLARLADAPAGLLSAGQSRRLALARCLAAATRLWLLDEPAAALDAASLSAAMEMIAEHRAAGGMVVATTNVALDLAGADVLDLAARAPAAAAP